MTTDIASAYDPSMTSIRLAQVARRLGLHPATAKTVCATMPIARNGSGFYSAAEVDRLAQTRRAHTYRIVPTPEAHPGPLGFAAPFTGEHGPSFYLSEDRDRQYAVDELARRGIEVTPGQEITGWWSLRESRAHLLADRNAVIIAVVGGYVREAARIHELAATLDYRTRRAFLVEPLTGPALEPYRGFVPGMSRTGLYVEAP